MNCPDCGQDHKDQIEKFPVGTVIKFNEYSGYGLGAVTGHADDGRAVVRMTNGSVHTFHRLEDAVEDMSPPMPEHKVSGETLVNLVAMVKSLYEVQLLHQGSIQVLSKQVVELTRRFEQQQGDNR